MSAETLKPDFADGGKPSRFWFNGVLITCDSVNPDTPDAWLTLVDLKALLTNRARKAIDADRHKQFVAKMWPEG